MDKVKIGLALLKKHHFWVMTGTVMLLGFIGWLMATSQLWGEYKVSKLKIESKFKDLTKIKGEDRENLTWIHDLDEDTKQLKAKVATAWTKVYTEQKDHVLEWPAVLGPNTVKELESLGPTDPIRRTIRNVYRNYIRGEFPELLKIVDARDYHLDETKGGKKPGVAGEPEHEYKVIWDATNQADIDKALDWKETPESQEMREAQEDLWVYKALLTIISKLNVRATGPYNAKVKEIQSLLIGMPAAEAFQAGMAEGRIEKYKEKESASSAAPPVVLAAALGPSASPGRYVNITPVAAAAAPGAPPATGPPAAPAEFKGMPVVMQLIMDQREISRLLVECANSPLPVEVRQFRVRAKNWTSSSRKRNNAAAAQTDESAPTSYDMAVEVQGIIYIFNPPDRAKLGDVAAAGVSPAQPASEPPAAKLNGATPPAAATPPAGNDGGAPAEPPKGEAGPEAAAGPGEMSDTDESPDSK